MNILNKIKDTIGILRWKNVYEDFPASMQDLIFLYDNQMHIGYVQNKPSGRPIKWVWFCTCCWEQFDMEELEYCKENAQPIVWYLDIPHNEKELDGN